ncbi:MAG: hypothetical protein EXS13_09015 [Planctomycetes bacterium]|nr:hypothetical protein [Planctomycetota bacterium]
MRLLTAIAVLPAAVALALAAGCSMRLGHFGSADVWVEATEKCDFNAADFDCVAVVTHNGRIDVIAGPEGREMIELVAAKRAGGDDLDEANAALAALVISRESRGRVLEIQADWCGDPSDDWEARVHFTLTVPPRLAARLESHNGDVASTGLLGAIDLSTHNGDITIAGARGRVTAESHNGRIECCADGEPIELSTHNGDICFATTSTRVSGAIESHNGDIEVDLPLGACGTIFGHGSFSARDLAATVQIDGRDFKVELGEPAAARLRLATHNGSVRLKQQESRRFGRRGGDSRVRAARGSPSR